MSTWDSRQAVLWAGTVRHLHASQVVHRVRLRAQGRIFGLVPGPSVRLLRRRFVPAPGWPADYLPLDRRLQVPGPGPLANSNGRFRFLGEERSLGEPFDWDQPGASRLWRYHLHYFEWAWSFAVSEPDWASKELRRLWRSWRAATVFGRGDAWSPYVASIRAWVMCGVYGVLVAGTEDESRVASDLALHAGYLRASLELDVGGNHLVKNLKALVGLGVFFKDETLVEWACRRLERQMSVQVLADGGHFERSPSYHCQVLGDLIDVCGLLEAAQLRRRAALDEAIIAMRRWLGAVLLPDGDVPLFNDCTLVGKERIDDLQPVRPSSERLIVLEASGYVVVKPEQGTQLVADVGLPCPPELPAHAHADCLSFELVIGGRRVLVDTGTSTYTAGQRRQHERSSRAHNTVEIDGEDQTEVWGAFRAARRARPRLERIRDQDGMTEIVASHDGYRRLRGSPIHRRSWRVQSGEVAIIDEVIGGGTHRVVARLHVAPGVHTGYDGGRVRAGPFELTLTGGATTVDDEVLATGFGQVATGRCIALSAEGSLPMRVTTTLSWTPVLLGSFEASVHDLSAVIGRGNARREIS